MQNRTIVNAAEFSSVADLARKRGFPHITRGGRSDGQIWLSRFVQNTRHDSPAIFVGYSPTLNYFIVYDEVAEAPKGKLSQILNS